jgi:hypothetical protein
VVLDGFPARFYVQLFETNAAASLRELSICHHNTGLTPTVAAVLAKFLRTPPLLHTLRVSTSSLPATEELLAAAADGAVAVVDVQFNQFGDDVLKAAAAALRARFERAPQLSLTIGFHHNCAATPAGFDAAKQVVEEIYRRDPSSVFEISTMHLKFRAQIVETAERARAKEEGLKKLRTFNLTRVEVGESAPRSDVFGEDSAEVEGGGGGGVFTELISFNEKGPTLFPDLKN